MKKLLQVGNLRAIEELKTDNGMIVIGRAGDQIWLQNIELLPTSSFRIDFDSDTNELTIKLTLKDGEYLAVKDMAGIAEKKVMGVKKK